MIIQDHSNKVCNDPLPSKIENDDDASFSFWDDLEIFITKLDIPRITTEKTNPVQQVIIEENVMETQVLEDLMAEGFVISNNKWIGKPTNLPSFDQQPQVHKMTNLPLDSFEFNILNQFDVMVERLVDKDEIRKRKPKFVITRGCPIRHFSRMDLKHEVLEVEDEITPVHVP